MDQLLLVWIAAQLLKAIGILGLGLVMFAVVKELQGDAD